MKIRHVPLEQVLRAATNAKLHDLPALEASIRSFGFLVPLVVDDRTGMLLAGHGRLEVLRRMHADGEPAPDGVQARGEEWRVPVVDGTATTDDRHAAALAVALNRIEAAGGWDPAELYRTLDTIAAAGYLDGTGFIPDDLDEMLVELTSGPMSFGGAESSARTDVGIAAKAETYRTNGVRSLVLDYPVAEYERLADALGRLRKARGAETNAVLVKMLLEEAR